MTTSTRRTTVPTQLAAMAAGVTEATIRKWASRGRLTRYGTPGRAEYDLAELYVLVSEREGTRVT
ncbi:MAG: transcriptional regulator [Actinophytocola sp.]|uniref:transcriptional regulator n=1 Tax=Actinophytocola sp. TaxID=1872138 RepID=UPI003C75726E